jgi:SAM-dependent methyltransferase
MKEFSGGIGARYDDLPYPGYSFPETHLSRLAAIGSLHGLESADPRGASVLELGCGSGTNLLAMAQLFPHALFHGVDVSRTHMDQAIAAAHATGICNVTFRCMDLLSLDKNPQGYDYILCHGLYSWVPDPVRKAVFRIIRESLRPSGIALVSYNCRPGWDFRGALRGMMMLHAGEEGAIRDRVAKARDLMRFLTGEVSEETPYGQFLRQEALYLEGRDDAYVAHDMLESENRALYFRDFMKAVSGCGLSYLGDARASVTGEADLQNESSNWLKKSADTTLEREQYLDFVHMRMFRSSLLCHHGAIVSESADPSRIGSLQVVSQIRLKQAFADGLPAVVTTLQGGDIPLPHPMTALLFSRLAELGGMPIQGEALLDDVIQRMGSISYAGNPSTWRSDLEKLLLRGYRKGMLDLRMGFPYGPSATPAPNFPKTLPLARWQADQKIPVSGRDLTLFRPDELTRKMITLCNGNRTRAELITLLAEGFQAGEFSITGLEGRDPLLASPVLESGYGEIIRRLESLGVLAEA